MIIDATDLIIGRMASFVAKKAMLGEKFDIINCEKAVVSGKRESLFKKYDRLVNLGRNPYKGPFYPRTSDRIVRRTIRGMLPYKQEKGRSAFESIMCYVGTPKSFEGQKAETLTAVNKSRLKTAKYITIGEISKHMGGSR